MNDDLVYILLGGLVLLLLVKELRFRWAYHDYAVNVRNIASARLRYHLDLYEVKGLSVVKYGYENGIPTFTTAKDVAEWARKKEREDYI